jgi:hypothetical protein
VGVATAGFYTGGNFFVTGGVWAAGLGTGTALDAVAVRHDRDGNMRSRDKVR